MQLIHPARVQTLKRQPPQKGGYVLYWMQQSQREACNHALEYAIQTANELNLPVLVCFGLTAGVPDANFRHYVFMLEGLKETQSALAKRKILMVVRIGSPDGVALSLGRKAAAIVCDRGYLRYQKAWRERLAEAARCPVIQVESNVIVPVEAASPKAEWAARTLRPKIHSALNTFLVEPTPTQVKHSAMHLDIEGVDLKDMNKVLQRLRIVETVPAVSRLFLGGTSQAEKRFADFLHTRLARYHQNGNQPQTDDVSHMSPYLHFGQISSLYLALQVRRSPDGYGASAEAFLEELIVRRELACNFVHYTSDYDRFSCIPKWAKATLADHRQDNRAYVYPESRLELAQTHDPYWNAAMREMRHTGFMHNYMRMYWGKKILEWSGSPEQAFQMTLALNNKYFLDGRDPNAYAGVAWIYGTHDRAWKERPVFGKLRYMAASGLERKCDIHAYIEKVDALERKMKL